MTEEKSLEQIILEAAENDSDHLQELLQTACEQMDEEQANKILDKVHQILKEKLRDTLEWKTND